MGQTDPNRNHNSDRRNPTFYHRGPTCYYETLHSTKEALHCTMKKLPPALKHSDHVGFGSDTAPTQEQLSNTHDMDI